jgi:protein-S-isoprenylcysteine O-methyltransferase Ste14
MAEKLLFIPWIMAILYSSIPLFWFAIHPLAPRWRKMERSPYRILLPLWAVIIAVLAAVTWPWHVLQLYSAWWSWLPAAFLLAVSARTYGKIRSAFGVSRFIGQAELRPGEYQQSLITGGLHGSMRHPIYIAHLGMLAGWTIGSGLLINFVLLAITAFCTFPLMIWLEERELEKRFGSDYREYKKHVPLLPRFRFHHENNLHGDIIGH